MCRGVRNWPFCPARGDLRQHVFVEVALGVAVLHRQSAIRSTAFASSCRGRDGEAGILHVVRVGRAIAAQGAKKREDVVGRRGEQLIGPQNP